MKKRDEQPRLTLRRRRWTSPWMLVLLLGGALACGSRTGLGGFSREPLDGAGGGSGGGGLPGTGATPGTGAGPSTGGVLGTGGLFGGGSGGEGIEGPLVCPLAPIGGFKPGETIVLDSAAFATEPLVSTRWTVLLDDCDAILPTPTFTAVGSETPRLELTPGRPGLYRIWLEVQTLSGAQHACELTVRAAGRGVRVDLCWDTSTTVDLDLYVHTPLNENRYYSPGGPLVPAELGDRVTVDTCNPANCGPFVVGSRPVFDLPDSPLEFCEAGPSAADFLAVGHCPNPRSGKDNNQQEATGTSEIVQMDTLRLGSTMRVMVQNFSNLPARPSLFIYCNDVVVPVELPGAPGNFVTTEEPLPGVLWRAADITRFESGDLVVCEIAQPLNPLQPGAPYLTVNDDAY